MLKKVLLLLAIMFSLFLIICAILPSTYRVERSVIIQAPDTLVYHHIADFEKWLEWSAWSQRDPEAVNTFKGEPAKVGQVWSWEGEIVGKGKMTHVEITPNNQIKSELEFFEPQPMIATSIMKMENRPAGIRVQMIMEGSLGYPIERLFGLAIDDIIGPDFEEGLNNLKEKLEK